jgi:hypothetical protein
MKPITRLTAIALFSLLFGCNSMKVTTDLNPDYSFASVSAYQWIDGPVEILEAHDTFISIDVQKALNNELADRGWKQVLEKGRADIQVTYYIKLKEHQEYAGPAGSDDPDFSGGFVYNRNNNTWGYKEREPDLNVYTVEVGTLSVLMYDVKSGERVWRGTLKTRIDRNRPLSKQQEHLRKVAAKIFAKLPE